MKDYYNDESKLIQGIWFEDENGMIQLERIREEESILTNQAKRAEMLNNIPYYKIEQYINRAKILFTLPDGYVTIEMAANFFEIKYDALKKSIQRNMDELIMNGLVILQGTELRDYKESGILGDFMSPNKFKRSLTLLDKRTLLNIAMLLRDSVIAKFIRSLLLDMACSDEGQQILLDKINNLEQLLVEQQKVTNEALRGMCIAQNKIRKLEEQNAIYKEKEQYILNNDNEYPDYDMYDTIYYDPRDGYRPKPLRFAR